MARRFGTFTIGTGRRMAELPLGGGCVASIGMLNGCFEPPGPCTIVDCRGDESRGGSFLEAMSGSFKGVPANGPMLLWRSLWISRGPRAVFRPCIGYYIMG